VCIYAELGFLTFNTPIQLSRQSGEAKLGRVYKEQILAQGFGEDINQLIRGFKELNTNAAEPELIP
jgi:hypothetical protein